LDVLKFEVEQHGNFKVGVCNKQSFEVVNALNKFRPDIFISRHMATVWSAKLGIPSLLSLVEPSEMLYDGLIRYGELILDTITNPAFINNIAKHSKLPYTNWWLEQDTYSFLGGKCNG
jgi:nitrogenase molybdenum-iron protein alpha chain